MQQSCACGSVPGASGQLASLPRPRDLRLAGMLDVNRGTASPFQWTFTRKDLTTLLAKIERKRLASAA
jgi:hypothetical protein